MDTGQGSGTKKLIIKLTFSVLVIILIMWRKVEVTGIVQALSNARLGWVFLSFMLHPVGLYISSYRWMLLLRAQSIDVSLGRLFQSYLVCGFFNQFLPTRVGGDLIRAYDTHAIGHSGTKSFAVVVVERASGIVMLLFFSLFFSVVRIIQGHGEPLYYAGALLGAGGVATLGLLCHPLSLRLTSVLLSHSKLRSVQEKVQLFHHTVTSYSEADKRGYFLKAFFLAFLLQLNVILHYYLLGLAFDFDLSLSIVEFFIIVPLVQVVLMVPFFINGIGIREVSWIAVFERYGIHPERAFAFSLIDFAMYLVFGIVGGILYAVRK